MMKKFIYLFIFLCAKFLWGAPINMNLSNITIDDIKSFLYCRQSALENIKFLYTLRSSQPRYPENDYKAVVVFGKAGNKVGVEKISKMDNSEVLYHSLYFFDGERGYFWSPEMNSTTLFNFRPFAESRVGEYLLPFTDWGIGQSLIKTLEDDDYPEIVESYQKDNERYIVFKTNVHSYVKEDLKYLDKSKWSTLDKNKTVYKCVYNVDKNLITHRELYINEPCNIILDVEEAKEISPGVYFPIKVSSKSFEKKPDGTGFRVRGYGTIIIKNVSIEREEDLIGKVQFEIPRGAEILNNRTMEVSINGESYIADLSQEEKDSISVAKRLFGLSYQDLLNMMNEIE